MAVAGFSDDTAANWASNNPTPNLDEMCWDTTNNIYKLGNGSTAYNSLRESGRAATKRRDVLPTTTFTGCFAETFPRITQSPTAQALATGIPRLAGMTLYAGEVVSNIGFVAGTGHTAATHQWAALTDSSGTVLAVSADATNAAWTSGTAKNFAMVSPYTVTATGVYYLALCQVATTPASPVSASGAGNLLTVLTPASAYTAASNTGGPPAVGASLGTLTAGLIIHYTAVS